MKRVFFSKIITLNLIQSLVLTLFLTGNTYAAFDSGSTGADGAFNPTAHTEVTLPADGKLNYTSVNIPTGVTVTFKRNSTNTPVYVLATGDVTIAGTINLNGTNANGRFHGKGGPGGFDGGFGGTPVDGGIPASPGGKGLGTGGGNPGSSASTNPVQYGVGGGGGGGGFASNGSDGAGNSTYAPGGSGGGSYGNINILPMIGGAGGGGGAGSAAENLKNSGGAGGGGGGAILIASSSVITVSGSITANGGKGGDGTPAIVYAGGGGGGSGGAVKLMADTITGDGIISAIAGTGGNGYSVGGAGGSGRIRLEATNPVTGTISTSTTPLFSYGYPGTVFVTNIPTLSITRIGGIDVPANPTGSYAQPDITLPGTTQNPVTVNISATNIRTGTTVTVTSIPEYGNSTNAAGALSGTDASSTASVSITLSTSYQSILTATATFTIQTAMYWDGEKIEKVRVAATAGKGSEAFYITESGKEIKAGELMAKLMK